MALITTAIAQVSVPYLTSEPVIDGFTDTMNQDFYLIPLDNLSKTSPANPDIKAAFFIAYSARFLYLYIETDGDSITIRDRGYQNGDGFHLMIGKPQKDFTSTDEFYVLGFSPEKSWCHQMTWYYNIDLKMNKLSSDTKFETGCRNGKISFELLLPWKEVYPYHPWLSNAVGFNLCFVKAVRDKDKNYYFLEEDDHFQSEQSRREYEILEFETPPPATSPFASRLQSNHIAENENPAVRMAGFSNSETIQNISISVVSGENAVAAYTSSRQSFPAGFSTLVIPVENAGLYEGGYKVKVYLGKELIGEHYLSVFPGINTELLREDLRYIDSAVSQGTKNTLMFYLDELDSAMLKIKDYETSLVLRNKISESLHYIEALKSGHDLLVSRKGAYRRAYLSEEDHQLYPYSVYVPEDYTGDEKYPLLVYLHGSGDDDRVLSGTPVIPEGYIVLAPNGRGTSNCYAGTAPQADIEEAIKDVIRNFNIDSTKIILSGFSMGGYGVYRTFYEHSGRYRAIAVISGHPDLARNWIGPDEPNFLDEMNLAKFNDIPIFIFHGKNDLNCPFDLTSQVVQKLIENGCEVTFEVDEGGHGSMDPISLEKYYQWLRQQVE